MIGALVLAAGESRRMGAHKMLLPFGGRTVIAHVAAQILACPVQEVLVVTGHEAAPVAAALAALPVRIVHNPDYPSGMLSSVRAGLRALAPACSAVLVALGDQPSIHPELIGRLIDEYARIAPGILVPCFMGRRGHPLIFSANYIPEIHARYDGEGLRGLLRAHPEDVTELPVPTDSVLSDMDYPEDYRRELERREREKDR